MRIAISTSVIQRGKTGVGQHVLALLRAYLNAPPDYEFLLLALEDDVPLLGFAADRMQIVTIPERFRPPVLNILWHQIVLPWQVRRLGIDLLHVPSYRRLLWPRPCALTGTIHDLAPFRVGNKYDPARMFYGRVLVKHLARRQHELIAVSHNTARDMQLFWEIPASRVTVIHNGIEHERFHPGDSEQARLNAAQRYQLDAPFFLYVARLEHPGKNHLRLIQAFEQFKTRTRSPWQLALAGSEWHGASVIHHAMGSSPWSRDIRWLGFVPDSELPELYRAAGAFVYPSLYEGFGMPPLEAMACGCPVISSPCGSLKELLADACILVDPLDVDGWTVQMERLATSSASQTEWRLTGLARARCFSWERTARETLQVYDRALRIAGSRRTAALQQCGQTPR